MTEMLNHHCVVALAVDKGVDAIAQLVGCIGVRQGALLQEQLVCALIDLGFEAMLQLPELARDAARESNVVFFVPILLGLDMGQNTDRLLAVERTEQLQDLRGDSRLLLGEFHSVPSGDQVARPMASWDARRALARRVREASGG